MVKISELDFNMVQCQVLIGLHYLDGDLAQSKELQNQLIRLKYLFGEN